MTLKRILTLLLIISIIPSIVFAQVKSAGKLTIQSFPEGASVKLVGDVIVKGVAPAIFRQPLIGNYKLIVSKAGYERYETKLILNPYQPLVVNVQLSPKTRFKSFSRSMFIPGWGQRYSGKKFKGYLFTVLSLGAAASYLIADNKFDDKFDTFNRLTREYDDLTVLSEKQSFYPRLVSAQQDAYDAEDVRRITVGTVIGIWSLNLLDALFFFPDNRTGVSIKTLSVNPLYKSEVSGIQISMKF